MTWLAMLTTDMQYDLFLDDERFPSRIKSTRERPIIIVRNFVDFAETIIQNGCPTVLYLDHDLGHEVLNGSTCMKFLLDYILDNNIKPNIEFHIHSQNPIGATAMRGYINDIKKVCN